MNLGNIYFIPLLTVIMLLLSADIAYSQSCDTNTPTFNIDMTGNPDSVHTIVSGRQGKCCGITGSELCIQFIVTLDPLAQGLRVDMSGGLGNTWYSVECGPEIPVGTINCMNGTGPFMVTVCKPGSNSQTYTISSVHRPHLYKNPVNTYPNCPQPLIIKGIEKSTITWTALSDPSHINFLSCTTGCDSSYFNPTGSNLPSFVEYEVKGYNFTDCDTNAYIDTIRVYIIDSPAINISTLNTIICPEDSFTTIIANATGGVLPYTIVWNDSITADSITVGPGTYIARFVDELGCYHPEDTIIIAMYSTPYADTGPDTSICSSIDSIQLDGTIMNATGGIWSGGNGTFLPDSSTLNAYYYPSVTEKSAGFVKLYLSTYGTGSCQGTADSILITILTAPEPLITGAVIVCEGDTAMLYQSPYFSGNTYDWSLTGGNITNGINTHEIEVNWINTGTRIIKLIETNTGNLCSNETELNVSVKSKPDTGTINY